jgi:hypothetical protein
MVVAETKSTHSQQQHTAESASLTSEKDTAFFSEQTSENAAFFQTDSLPAIQTKAAKNRPSSFFQPGLKRSLQLKCSSCEAEQESSNRPLLQSKPAFESEADGPIQAKFKLHRMPAFESEADPIQPKRLVQRQVETEAEPQEQSHAEADLHPKLADNATDPPEDNQDSTSILQSKLTIGKPGDRFEQEADAMADRVVSSPKTRSDLSTRLPAHTLQKTTLKTQRQGGFLQPKHLQRFVQLQAQGQGKLTASSDLSSRLQSSRGGGSALDQKTQGDMGAAFGADFSKIRIHTDSNAVQLNQDLGAKAFTHGSDIYFNAGQYNPGASTGKHLLAHELTHTLQQGATTQLKPDIQREENEDLAAELEEADREQQAAVDSLPAEQTRQQAEAEAVAAEQAAQEQTPEAEAPAPQDQGKKGGEKATRVAEPQPSKPDRVKPQVNEDEPKGEVGQALDQQSAEVCNNAAEKAQTLADHQQAHDEAGEKLQQTESAVVPPTAEGQSRSNAEQVDTLETATEPAINPQDARRERDQALAESVPNSVEAMNEFESEGKGQVVGNRVLAQTSAEVGEIQGTYSEIENAPPAPTPEQPETLPEIEVAPETPQLNLGEGAVPELAPEHTDASEFDQQSDELLEKEGITQDQLDMVDSGELAEANKDRKTLKQKVQEQPAEVQAFAKAKQQKVKTDMQQEEAKDKAAMQQKRQQELEGSRQKQQETKSALELKREAVTQKINKIYETAKQTVTTKLENLEKASLKRFDTEQARYSKLFEVEVKRDINAWKRKRYSGLFAGVKWLKDKIVGIDHFPEVKRAFSTARERYVQRIDQLIISINKDNQKVIQDCKKEITKARQKIKEFVDGLGPELKKAGQTAMQAMQTKLKEMDGFIDKKKKELQQKLCNKKDEAIKAIDKKIEQMKSEMGGLVGKLGKLLLNAMLKFFKWAIQKIGGNSDRLMGILNKGESVIKRIVKDPVAFFKNVVQAVGGGIKGFVARVKQYLIKGLLSWLTGAMGDAGLQLPETFDLKGIFSLMLQIFGLTWNSIRTKLAKRVGEKVVAAAEKGVDIIKRVITEGPIALWNIIKEKAGEIKTQVMEGIRNWAITQIVKKATVKLLTMLNPVGAIVQAIIAIYDVVMFFIENFDRIVTFVKSIFDSIGEIAMGQIGKAAGLIEKSLGMTIPIILSFLARFLGLSGIGKAIRNVMARVRKPVDKVIDKIVGFLAKRIKKLFGKEKTGKGEVTGKYTPQEKAKGIKAISQEEKSLAKNDKISKEKAHQVANRVKEKHAKVFKNITVIDGKDSWDYQYIMRQGGKVDTPVEKEESELPELKIGDFYLSFKGQALEIISFSGDKFIAKEKGGDEIKFKTEVFRQLIQKGKYKKITESELSGLLPAKRYLPAGWKGSEGSKSIRYNFYERHGWTAKSASKKISEVPGIIAKVNLLRSKYALAANSSLRGTIVTEWKQQVEIGKIEVPFNDNYEQQITSYNPSAIEYQVDHEPDLSKAWNSSGNNNNDSHRKPQVIDDSNLQVVTAQFNRRKAKEKYDLFVKKNFESLMVNSPKGSKKINGEPFLDAPGGKPI